MKIVQDRGELRRKMIEENMAIISMIQERMGELSNSIRMETRVGVKELMQNTYVTNKRLLDTYKARLKYLTN